MATMRETRQDLSTHTRFTEEASRLDSAEMLDGLQPAQIVRRWTKSGGGLAASVAVDLIDSLQECPDAGSSTSVSEARRHEFGLQGASRYVANPCTEKAQHPGLWVGGPLRYGQDQRTGTEMVWQTLTRVRHVGSWSASGTSGVSLQAVRGDASGASLATAALKKCRPVWRIGTDRRSPFRDDWPTEDTAEFAWRHWAHESEAALLAVPDTSLTEIVRHFSPDQRDWHVVSRRFEIDPETNGGVFVCTGVAKTVGVVDAGLNAESSLASLPHKFQPVKRERTRRFGLAHDGMGEAHYMTLTCVWEDLSPASRPNFTWLDNARSVDLIVRAEPPWNAVATTKDENGYHWTGSGSSRAPWWRLADVEISTQDDGLLTLKVTWEMPEVQNMAGADTIETEVYGGSGWGSRKTVTAPTVPTERAEEVEKAMRAPAKHVELQRGIQERGQGYADVTGVFHRVWGYTDGADMPPGVLTFEGVTAPDIEWRPDYCNGNGGFALTFYRVARESVNAVVAAARSALAAKDGARIRSVHLREDEDGSCEVRVESETRKTVAEFVSVIGGDFFTNVYRREYDGLNIDDSGRVTDSHGAAMTLVDALGNIVPTQAIDGSKVLFKPGVTISVQFQRGADCKYHAVVTTEVAVAREWSFSYGTSRGGHRATILVHAWRNWQSQQQPPSTNNDMSADARDEVNRFGLHDGQWSVTQDIRELVRRTESDDALTHTTRTDTMLGGDGSSSASAGPGESVTRSVTEYSDSTHDTSVTREKAKTHTTPMTWNEKRGGHDISVRHTVTQNGNTPSVSTGANERVSVSASVNRFGKVDSTVHAETDVYVQRRVEEQETAFQKTRRETVNVDGSGDTSASGGTGGSLVSGADDIYSDSKHDTTRVEILPKPQSWTWQWPHAWAKGRHDVETDVGYGYGYRNWPSTVAPATPRAPAGAVMQCNAHWQKNEFGLYDGTVTFYPISDGSGNDSTQWSKSFFFDLKVTERAIEEDTGLTKVRYTTYHIHVNYEKTQRAAYNYINGWGSGSYVKYDPSGGSKTHPWKAVRYPLEGNGPSDWIYEGQQNG